MDTWSSAVASAWGKTSRDDIAVLPLVRHLADSAAMAGVLWDDWLAQSIKDEISRSLPDGLADGRKLYTFLAGVHDIGKLTPAFARQITFSPGYQWVLDDMARHDLVCPLPRRPGSPPRHCLLGHWILTEWFGELTEGSRKDRRRIANGYASPIGSHHGVPPTYRQLNQVNEALDIAPTSAWSRAQAEVLTGMARQSGALSRLPEWLGRPLPLPSQMALAGAIVVADWLASDQARFPFGNEQSSQARAEHVLSGWDLPRPWRATTPCDDPARLLAKRFPALTDSTVRPLQEGAIAAAKSMTRPGLMIIEAGMGEGKTEAALLAAEHLASRFGSGGVVFALPTQATSDGIFPRLRDWVQTLGIPATSMSLAHGKAALNEDYRELAARGRFVGVGDTDDELNSIPIVTSWLRGRRRGVLANFVAATIDQVLFTALSARFVHLRHLALAGKIVVVDEVHAADTFMRVYLCRALGWFAAHGTSVILLSATLPPHIRAELIDGYAEGTPVGDVNDVAYPRITLFDSRLRSLPIQPSRDRRARLYVRLAERWQEEVCRAVAAGGCVAVVHNTVDRAQATYDELCSRVGAERVTLLHSRFLSTARVERERRLREMLGPPGSDGNSSDRPRGYVVIGTQVLEQSLDIDLDLMVSDIAPIDLLLQRGGRVHRHRRAAGARPASLAEPTLLIAGVETSDAGRPPTLDSGAVAVYGKAALLRALVVLHPHLRGCAIDLTTDLPNVVAEAYRADLPSPIGWEGDWLTAEKTRLANETRMREEAAPYLLPPPNNQSAMVGLLVSRSDEPDDDGSARSRARVRDTDESIEVIVVRRSGGQVTPMPEAGLPEGTILPTELGSPADDVARRLAACTVRLPAAMTPPWRDGGGYMAIDRVINDLEKHCSQLQGWSQSPWLKGELVLILDECNRAVIDGWELTYDADHGLRHTKKRG